MENGLSRKKSKAFIPDLTWYRMNTSQNRLRSMSTKSNGAVVSTAAIIVQGVANDVLFDWFQKRKIKEVVILEGRPSLEAARVNCRALAKRKIKSILIADNMAGFLFFNNRVKEVWLSYYIADRKGA